MTTRKNPISNLLVPLVFLILGLTIFGTVGFAQEAASVEINRLKDELRRSKAQLDQAIQAGFVPCEAGFASAQEMLERLPKHLEVRSNKKWDEARDFIQAEAVGKPFAAKLRIHKLEVKPNREAAADESIPKYNAEITFFAEQFPIRGMVIEQSLFTQFPLRFSGDESLAEKLKKLQRGKAYELRGVISEVKLAPHLGDKNKIDVKLDLARPELESVVDK